MPNLAGLKRTRMKRIALVVLLLSASSEVHGGQGNQDRTNELTRLLEMPSCKRNSQSRQMVCEAVLPRPMDTKRNKVGDHILLRTDLVTGSAEAPITILDAAVVEVQPRAKGRSVLRIRIDKAVRKDGHELPVEARIVAVISQSSVTEAWDYPAIIVDRFPRIPEDDQRQPGERKLSENPPHTSPLDSLPDVPVRRRAVCPEKTKKRATNPCTNLLEARGTYGFKTVTLEPADAASPTESALSSKKNMSFRAGTVLVVEVKRIP